MYRNYKTIQVVCKDRKNEFQYSMKSFVYHVLNDSYYCVSLTISLTYICDKYLFTDISKLISHLTIFTHLK